VRVPLEELREQRAAIEHTALRLLIADELLKLRNQCAVNQRAA
jgi:hypothetical protein